MKWTYRLMTASCVLFTTAQVLVSQDWALDLGLANGWASDASAIEMASASADEATLSILSAPNEVERILHSADPVRLDRNPFNPSALIPMAQIGSAAGSWYSVDMSGPARWQKSGRTAAHTRSAGRLGRPGRPVKPAEIRKTTIAAEPRVTKRIDRSKTIFEQTRFGALHKKQAAQHRRSTRSGKVRNSRR